MLSIFSDKEKPVVREPSNQRINKRENRGKVCSTKWVYLNISRVHRKAPVLESLFYKAAGLQTRNFKKRLQDRCFLVNFEKFLRGPFLRNTFGKYVCWFYVTVLFCNYKKLSFWVSTRFVRNCLESTKKTWKSSI